MYQGVHITYFSIKVKNVVISDYLQHVFLSQSKSPLARGVLLNQMLIILKQTIIPSRSKHLQTLLFRQTPT